MSTHDIMTYIYNNDTLNEVAYSENTIKFLGSTGWGLNPGPCVKHKKCDCEYI